MNVAGFHQVVNLGSELAIVILPNLAVLLWQPVLGG